MLSKNFARYIRSLELKKYRDQECSFVVEGPKAVADFMAVSQPKTIVATNKWYQNAGIKPRQTDIITCQLLTTPTTSTCDIPITHSDCLSKYMFTRTLPCT